MPMNLLLKRVPPPAPIRRRIRTLFDEVRLLRYLLSLSEKVHGPDGDRSPPDGRKGVARG